MVMCMVISLSVHRDTFANVNNVHVHRLRLLVFMLILIVIYNMCIQSSFLTFNLSSNPCNKITAATLTVHPATSAHMRSEGYWSHSVRLYVCLHNILKLKAVRRVLNDTNSFSATRP